MRRRSVLTIWAALIVALLLLAAAAPAGAQAPAPSQDEHLLTISNDSLDPAPAPDIPDTPLAVDPGAPSSPQVDTSSGDDNWHFSVSPYLWFPGVHGTVGARNRAVSVHASPGDLLSNFRFGLMGAGVARYKRLVLSLDMMWVRLEDDKALPFPNLEVNTAKFTGSEFILTPKIGFRVVDQEKFKIDALTGFRYWHFEESLKFTPSNLNLNFSSSQNWVDPLVGGRIQLALSPKIVLNVLGDVGGWGTGSQLEYQVAGLLGFRIKPNVTLEAGYRYLDVNYRSTGTIIDMVTSGVLFGVTIALK